MIHILRLYNPKKEFKLFNSGFNYMLHTTDYLHLEKDLTFCIDAFITRWKKLEMLPDTYKKLHRYAISKRHYILSCYGLKYGTK